MDAAPESNEIQKGLNQLCMGIISIHQNIYSQSRKKQLRKLSRAHWAFKNPRNKVEITTLISK